MNAPTGWKRIFGRPYWREQITLQQDAVAHHQAESSEAQPTSDTLAESEKRFSLAFEHAPIAIAFAGPNFRFLKANATLRRAFDYTEEELQSLTFVDLTHPEDVEKGEELSLQLARGEIPSFKLKKRYRTKSGETFWGEITVTKVHDSDGAFLYSLVMLENITDRKHSEEALRQTQNRFRILVDTAPVMIWMAGTDQLFDFFNQSWLDFTGRRLEQELGLGWFEGIHPDDVARCRTIYFAAFYEKNDFEMEYRLRRFNGEYRWVLNTGIPRFTLSGRFTGYMGSCLDITERKRAEEALRESEARLHTLGDNLPNGAIYQIVREPDGKIYFSYMSAGISQLAGVTADEVMKDYRVYDHMILEEDRPRMRAASKESMRSLSIFDVEARLLTSQGQVKWIHLRSTPRHLPNGGTLWDGVMLDVTNTRRDLEALLKTVGVIVWEGEEDLTAKSFRFTFVSQQAERLLGYPIKDWMGQPTFWLDHLHPEDRLRTLAERCQAIAEKRDYELEYRMITKDGRTVWLRGIVKVIVVNDHFLKLRGITVDITERKLMEDALHQGETSLRMLLETTDALPWQADAQTWQMTYVGPRAAKLLGYPREQWYEEDFWVNHLHPNDRERAVEFCLQSSANLQNFEFEYRMVSAEGKSVCILDVVNVERENGKPRLLRGFMIDVTDRRHSEEALRRSHTQIRDLAGKLIFAQEEERKRISRELHDDVNQQLAALVMAVSNIQRRLPDPEGSVSNQLTNLQNRIVKLSDDVRLLSHELHPAVLEHVGLVAALKSYCPEFSRREEIEIKLTIDNCGETIPPNVALCLYRMTQESLQNIARHSGAREASIRLANHNGDIHLTIADKGTGFDLEQAKRKGSLGLVSIEERVRLLGGSLRIKTQLGLGTELQAQIPLRRSE
ncbi:MAG: PAS domain S-box protein [Acidobacteria bacterium]|nr:PAS domain S-box protein [Acidobacteriota bacterium]